MLIGYRPMITDIWKKEWLDTSPTVEIVTIGKERYDQS